MLYACIQLLSILAKSNILKSLKLVPTNYSVPKIVAAVATLTLFVGLAMQPMIKISHLTTCTSIMSDPMSVVTSTFCELARRTSDQW